MKKCQRKSRFHRQFDHSMHWKLIKFHLSTELCTCVSLYVKISSLESNRVEFKWLEWNFSHSIPSISIEMKIRTENKNQNWKKYIPKLLQLM